VALGSHFERFELQITALVLVLRFSAKTVVAWSSNQEGDQGDASAAVLAAAATTALVFLLFLRNSLAGKLCFGTSSSSRPTPAETRGAEAESDSDGTGHRRARATEEESSRLQERERAQEDADFLDREFETAMACEYDLLGDPVMLLNEAHESEAAWRREYEDAMACEYEAALAQHLSVVMDACPEEEQAAATFGIVAGELQEHGGNRRDVVSSQEERYTFWRCMLKTAVLI
jgi:hypothetical protein